MATSSSTWRFGFREVVARAEARPSTGVGAVSPRRVVDLPIGRPDLLSEEGRRGMPTQCEDKDAICELLAEYCFRLDECRFDEFGALFTDTAEWGTGAHPAEGARPARDRGTRPQHRARAGRGT